MRTAILVLSNAGLTLARRLRAASPQDTVIFGPSCVVGHCRGVAEQTTPTFPADEPGVFGWVGPLRKVFPLIWAEFDAIIAVMALGIVVRLVGPLAADKRRDPAVVVIDDAGRFAVSVLGGHGSGGNELARAVAATLDAVPVITTASETQGVPAVDRIGSESGWTIEWAENLTRVAAAAIRRERIAVWQDAGAPNWCGPTGGWPAHFFRIDDWGQLDPLDPAGVLVISDRVVPQDLLPRDRTLVYRPQTLVVGVGCKRATPRDRLDEWVDAVFTAHGLSTRSLTTIATVMLKLDEPGLVAFAIGRGVPLVAFPPEQLDGHPGIVTPSERVLAKLGIAAVAEPAALRAAGATRLIVPKQKGSGVTVAVARRE
jgi:cobalt-precorrin 5A hydrolase